MAWLSKADLDRYFTYQAPTAEDVVALRKVREKARELAELILDVTPPCADQSDAVRKVREAVMTANAAIVCRKRGAPGPNAYLGEAARGG